MLYMIQGEDTPGTLDQRLAARPAHLERLQGLLAAGVAAAAETVAVRRGQCSWAARPAPRISWCAVWSSSA